MKILLTLSLLLLYLANISAQDTIVKKDGNKIICRITKEDSTQVYFTTEHNGLDINTLINRENISEIRYQPRLANGSIIQNKREPQIVSFGLGLGFDYGGIGINLCAYPIEQIGIFLGAGYNFLSLGVNVGTKVRFLKREQSSITPYLIGMYGYNAVISVQGANQYNKTFYGATIGLGLEVFTNENNNNSLAFAILLPIRPELNSYIDDLENNHNIKFKSKPLPIGISIGYIF